jgi:hypothetical protein
MMSVSSIAGFAFVGGVFSFIAASYRNLISYAQRLKRFAIKDVTIVGDKVCLQFLEEIIKQGFKLPYSSKYEYETAMYDHCLNQTKDRRALRTIPDETILRKKFVFFKVNFDSNNKIQISYFRCFKLLDRIIEEALLNQESSEIRQTHRYYFYRRISGTNGSPERAIPMKSDGEEVSTTEETSHYLKTAPETALFLNPEVDRNHYIHKGSVKKEMIYCWGEQNKKAEIEFQRWLDSENWHKSRKIMWKRSICLKGAPGTGKTSFVRYLGKKYGVPILSFDLATFNNVEFSQKWANQINGASPCIILIEDIDAVFDGRENVCNKNSMEQMLTFDCLLNCIDGVEDNDGMFLVITTNHYEKLDPALTRAGRVDRTFEIGMMEESARRELANKIIDHMNDAEIESQVVESEGMTAAEAYRKFVEVALNAYWKQFDDLPGYKVELEGNLVSNSPEELPYETSKEN